MWFRRLPCPGICLKLPLQCIILHSVNSSALNSSLICETISQKDNTVHRLILVWKISVVCWISHLIHYQYKIDCHTVKKKYPKAHTYCSMQYSVRANLATGLWNNPFMYDTSLQKSSKLMNFLTLIWYSFCSVFIVIYSFGCFQMSTKCTIFPFFM